MPFGGDAMLVGKAFAASLVGFGHGSEFYFFGVLKGEFSKSIGAALAGTHENCFNGFHEMKSLAGKKFGWVNYDVKKTNG